MYSIPLDLVPMAAAGAQTSGPEEKKAPAVLLACDVRTCAATSSHAGAESSCAAREWKLLLVDEAAQASEPMIAQAMNLASSETRVCQIGDHKQLPATVNHPANRAGNSQASMFERLMHSGNIPFVVLDDQYRMPEAVASYPNSEFYGGALVTATAPADAPYGVYWPSKDPIAFVNVRSRI